MPDIGLVDANNPVLNHLDDAAARYGVDRNLVHTVAQMESNYNPAAVSGAGAQGVMQLMPAMQKHYGVTDPFDPAQNADGGVQFLRDLNRKYGGDTRLVLAAYNAGEPAVDRAGGVPNFKETKNYVNNGMSILGSAPKAANAAAPDIGLEDASPAPQTLTLPATIKTPQNVQILPPLSEPPGQPVAPEQKSAKGFADNLVTSAYNNIISPVVHPGQTLAGISNLLEGMGEMTGNVPVPGMQGRQAIEGLTNLYTQRYGSWQGFKDAWYKDPVGMVGDLAIAVDGLGLGKAAAQDFIRASGLSDAAMAARDTLASTASKIGRVPRAGGAFVTGAVQAVPEAAKSAVSRGIDLALGGPHAMVLGAKAQFGKQILQAGMKAAKDVWTGAGEVPAAAETVAEAAPAAAPVAAAPTPQTPPAAPAAPRTFDQVYADLLKLSEQNRPSARVMSPTDAAQVFPDVYGQPPPPVAPAAPQAAPAAPEAPATTQEPSAAPVVPGAPQTLQPAAAVEKLTDYVLGKKIAPHMIDRLPAEYWQMIADDAGTAVPTADEIAQIKANVAAKAVETPVQGEQVFETQKARIEEGMTPGKTPPTAPGGAALTTLQKQGIPEHYQWLQDINPDAVGRAFEKDLRVADYLLSRDPPITPEEFAAKTLEEQNKLIREAPAASAKGKHLPYVPEPEGGAPRTKGRWAHEGINDLVNTMRWRQAQTPAAPEPAAIPTEGLENTPVAGKAGFEAEKAKPAPAEPAAYQPKIVIHGMSGYDSNLWDMVQSGDAPGFGMVQKTYTPELRTDTTSAATRAAYERLLDSRRARLTPERIRAQQKEFDRLLEADKQAFAEGKPPAESTPPAPAKRTRRAKLRGEL